jgi:hypothetical protein
MSRIPCFIFLRQGHQARFFFPIFLSDGRLQAFGRVCLKSWLEADFGLCYSFIDPVILAQNRPGQACSRVKADRRQSLRI